MTGTRVKLGLRTGTVVSETDGYFVSVRWDDTGATTRVPMKRLTVAS